MLVQVKARLQPAKPIQKFPKMLETRRDFFVSGTKNSRETVRLMKLKLGWRAVPTREWQPRSPNTVS